jgi:hypothetical protein
MRRGESVAQVARPRSAGDKPLRYTRRPHEIGRDLITVVEPERARSYRVMEPILLVIDRCRRLAARSNPEGSLITSYICSRQRRLL